MTNEAEDENEETDTKSTETLEIREKVDPDGLEIE